MNLRDRIVFKRRIRYQNFIDSVDCIQRVVVLSETPAGHLDRFCLLNFSNSIELSKGFSK